MATKRPASSPVIIFSTAKKAKLSEKEWNKILREFSCSQSSGKKSQHQFANGFVSTVFGWPQTSNTTSSMWRSQPRTVT